MNNEEAIVLINSCLKKEKKKNPNLLKSIGVAEILANCYAMPMDILVVIITRLNKQKCIVPLICIHAIMTVGGIALGIKNYNDEIKEDNTINNNKRIQVLKQLKYELKHNQNLFQNVEAYEFENALKEIEINKTKLLKR